MTDTKNDIAANYMEVQVPGKTHPAGVITTATGTYTTITKKRNSKSYKSELKAMVKERDMQIRHKITWSIIALMGWFGFITVVILVLFKS